MSDKFFRWGNVALWVIVGSVLLFFVVNWLLFLSFQQDLLHQQLLHPETGPVGNVRAQIWSYCGTDAFKVVSISLMIPIFLAAVGGAFKIRNAVEERIRKAQDERTKERFECVRNTAELWNKIYTLTSEVRFFKVEEDKTGTKGKVKGKKGKDENGEDEEEEHPKDIKDIIWELEKLCSSGEDIINSWHFRFPNLKDKDASLFVYFMNILLCSSTTVAYCIRDWGPKNKGKIKELQNSLGVIQDVIRSVAHHPILLILNDSVNIRRHDLPAEDKKKAKDEIKSQIAFLKEKAIDFEIFEWENNDLLSDISKKDKVEEFDAFQKAAQKAAQEAENWYRDNPKPTKKPRENFEKYLKRLKEYRKTFEEKTEFKEFEKAFDSIGLEKFAEVWEIEYSKEYLKKLAQRLGFEYMYQKVEGAAEAKLSQE
jgi:hypothetical protein